MKKIALFLWVALCCTAAHAADGKSLFVTFNDGSKTTEKTASFDLWKVSTFTYGATSTGINQLESNDPFAIEGNRIIVDGTSNRISIFALDGKAVSITPILSGNKTIIKLDGLNQGVYIIKINNKSIKIARQ